MLYKHYQNIFNKMSFCQVTKSFWPITYISTAWIQGSATKILVTDDHHYKREGQLGNEVNSSSL